MTSSSGRETLPLRRSPGRSISSRIWAGGLSRDTRSLPARCPPASCTTALCRPTRSSGSPATAKSASTAGSWPGSSSRDLRRRRDHARAGAGLSPNRPSTANDRHKQQPVNVKLARALNSASNARDTIVMSTSAVPLPVLGPSGPDVLVTGRLGAASRRELARHDRPRSFPAR